MMPRCRPVLEPRGVRVREHAADRVAAVHRCADVLEELGAVHPAYREAMLDREWAMSTYVGEGVAIPHGLDRSRALVRRDSLAVLRFPDGVEWDGATVTVCVAIAARGDGHVALLSALARILLDPLRAKGLREATDPAEIVGMLNAEDEP
ncbi:PTS sugar transporter subunit IIA [Pseudosporangium ferrugineum]|uniref:Mannitol-specific phosphotransferase enzyme IIA component n=1 Tax=Pseudosporangium ferrugineum TaxID=439699 RepID=A0A2T0S880_9ACTN|nr:PTS sugar transporter subunit IIA [Pseudosporangium ferrugineum]PRY29628.1 PTS system IIA component (Fru family) [Pseudosporangium ferrugineum]